MKQEKEEIKDKLSYKEWALDYASRSTITGIYHFARSTRIVTKLFWLSSFVIFTVLTAMFIHETFSNYFEYKVDTSVELVTEDGEVEFPTITICNLQICGFAEYDYSSFLKKLKQEEEAKLDSKQDNAFDEKLASQQTKTNLFSAKEVFIRNFESGEELNNVLNGDANSFDRLNLSCSLSGQKCNEEDFDEILLNEFQRCYKFNSGKHKNKTVETRKIRNFGVRNGFKMELYIGAAEECKSPLGTTTGVIIFINNRSFMVTEEEDGKQNFLQNFVSSFKLNLFTFQFLSHFGETRLTCKHSYRENSNKQIATTVQ